MTENNHINLFKKARTTVIFEASADLFGGVMATQWLPDELLFSLISRHHRLSGNINPSSTNRQLFGTSSRVVSHHFIGQLDEFARRTHGSLGDADTLIREHTILPLYLPFLTAAQAKEAMSTMQASFIGSQNFYLGTSPRQFHFKHPLKACLTCMQSDRERWGIAYWHRLHQIPGVWLCPAHDSPLQTSTIQREMFDWHLPVEQGLQAIELWANQNQLASDEKTRQHQLLRRLSDAATAMFQLPADFHFKENLLCKSYQHLTKRKLPIAFDRQGGHPNAFPDIDALDVATFGTLPEFSSLALRSCEIHMQPSRPRLDTKVANKALCHLFWITAHFTDFEEFFEQYLAMENDCRSSPLRDSVTIDLGYTSERRARRHEQKRARARALWLQVVGGNPLTGPTAMRILEPRAYDWLKRNDRYWLKTQSAEHEQLLMQSNKRPNRDAHDAELAQSILKAATQIMMEQPNRRVTVARLYRCDPALRAQLESLDTLPLSSAVLTFLLKYVSYFGEFDHMCRSL